MTTYATNPRSPVHADTWQEITTKTNAWQAIEPPQDTLCELQQAAGAYFDTEPRATVVTLIDPYCSLPSPEASPHEVSNDMVRTVSIMGKLVVDTSIQSLTYTQDPRTGFFAMPTALCSPSRLLAYAPMAPYRSRAKESQHQQPLGVAYVSFVPEAELCLLGYADVLSRHKAGTYIHLAGAIAMHTEFIRQYSDWHKPSTALPPIPRNSENV